MKDKSTPSPVATGGKSNTAPLLIGAAGLGLVGLGLWWSQKRKTGLTGTIAFQHRYTADDLWVGVGWVSASWRDPIITIGVDWAPYNSLIGFSYVDAHVDLEKDWVRHEAKFAAEFPEPLAPAKYHVMAFLQKKDGTLNTDHSGFVATRWYKDVFEIKE